jgi:hypothetical protein
VLLLLGLAIAAMLALAGEAQAARSLRVSPFAESNAPTITGLSSHEAWSTGGREISVYGTNLEEVIEVRVGDQEAEFEESLPEQLEITVPPEDKAAQEAGGKVRISVRTAYGTDEPAPGEADILTYTAPVNPAVTQLNPVSGPVGGGSFVQITGEGFREVPGGTPEVTGVKFGTRASTFWHITSPTTITAESPAGEGTVDVTVQTKAGTSPTGSADRFRYAPVPQITELNPKEGPPAGGNETEIRGSHFAEAGLVSIGNKEVPFTVTESGNLRAKVPAGTGSVEVRVKTPGGLSAGAVYTYVAPSAPTVTSVSPQFGPLSGGTSVSIHGAGFKEGDTVKFGSSSAGSASVESASEIRAFSPAGTGTVDITVTGPGGTSPTSSADRFTYLPQPVITKVVPAEGPPAGGTLVTITGSGLGHVSNLRFGSSQATNVKVESESQVTAAAPAGPEGTTVEVIFETPGGVNEQTAASRFRYRGKPFAPELSREIGSEAGGQTITLSGENYTGATAVSFGGAAAESFEVVSDQTIRAVSPAGHGTVDVTVTTGLGTSPIQSQDRFTYVAPTVITGVTPSSGFKGSATVAVVHGEHLGSQVFLNGKALPLTTPYAETEQGIVVPAGSETGDIRDEGSAGLSEATPADLWTVIDAPAVTGISPGGGGEHGGTKVTIHGTNLGYSPAVMFGEGTAKAVEVRSQTEIVATSPAGTGTVDVTVSGANGLSAPVPADKFQYQPSAVAPDIGHCAKLSKNAEKKYTGGYATSKCEVAAAEHDGKYEWSFGLAHPAVTISAGPVRIQAPSDQTTVSCTSLSGAGEINGTTEIADVQIVFHGCSHGGESCSSGATPGEVALEPLAAKLGWENKAARKGAIRLGPVGGGNEELFVAYHCGPTTVAVVGQVFAPVKVGKSSAGIPVKYAGNTNGHQKLTGFEGGPFGGLAQSDDGGPGFAGVALIANVSFKTEETVELNPVL